MRIAILGLGLALGLGGCSQKKPTSKPGDVIARGWDAHEAVIAAGEHAASCGEVATAMRRALGAHRQDLAEAFALERDTERLATIVDYLEAHQERLDELARRDDALRARCPDDADVVAAFRDLQPP